MLSKCVVYFLEKAFNFVFESAFNQQFNLENICLQVCDNTVNTDKKTLDCRCL